MLCLPLHLIRPHIPEIEVIHKASHTQDALQMLAQCALLTRCIARMADVHAPSAHDADWDVLRRMIGFVQARYTEPISLAEIAAAGAVCRNRCCQIFRGKLNLSPMQYVTQYRLDKSCAMMMGGASMTETALACGFHSSSYFAETFKKAYGISPRAYRALRRGCKKGELCKCKQKEHV